MELICKHPQLPSIPSNSSAFPGSLEPLALRKLTNFLKMIKGYAVAETVDRNALVSAAIPDW